MSKPSTPFAPSTAVRSALFGLALLTAGLTLAGIDTLATQHTPDAAALMALHTPSQTVTPT